MAIRAAGKGGRAWSDVLLGRPWLLVAAVALLVAMPVLVLGQASESDTRARLDAAQAESAAHIADVVSSNFTDRENLLRATAAASDNAQPRTAQTAGEAVGRMVTRRVQSATTTREP